MHEICHFLCMKRVPKMTDFRSLSEKNMSPNNAHKHFMQNIILRFPRISVMNFKSLSYFG